MYFFLPAIVILLSLSFGVWGLIVGIPLVFLFLTFRQPRRSHTRSSRGQFREFMGGSHHFGRNQPVTITQIGFNSFFQIAGHISKSDGRVTNLEIQQTTEFMQRLSLAEEQQQVAISCFNEGKSSAFDINRCLEKLRASSGMGRLASELLFEAMVKVAVLDGVTDTKQTILIAYASALHINRVAAEAYIARFRTGFRQQRTHQQSYRQSSSEHQQSSTTNQRELNDAYTVLGVSASDTDTHIKRTYKRKIAETHPDKFVGKDLPEFLINAANEKASEINRAWDVVKRSRRLT